MATHTVLEGNKWLLLLQDGYTPLHWAAEAGSAEVVELLLGAGAAVDAVTKVRPAPMTDWAQHVG